MQRKHSAHRNLISNQLHMEFQSRDRCPLVIHWDGKMMENSTDKQSPKSSVDRLAVVVTGDEVEKILGIVKLPSGTGKAQANATIQLMNLW